MNPADAAWYARLGFTPKPKPTVLPDGITDKRAFDNPAVGVAGHAAMLDAHRVGYTGPEASDGYMD